MAVECIFVSDQVSSSLKILSQGLQGDFAKPEKWLNEPGPGDGLVASRLKRA